MNLTILYKLVYSLNTVSSYVVLHPKGPSSHSTEDEFQCQCGGAFDFAKPVTVLHQRIE